jgi:hypothetical protein
MSLLNNACELSLRNAFVFYAHLYGEPKPAAIAWADGDRADHLGFARFLLELLSDEINAA